MTGKQYIVRIILISVICFILGFVLCTIAVKYVFPGNLENLSAAPSKEAIYYDLPAKSSLPHNILWVERQIKLPHNVVPDAYGRVNHTIK